MRATLISILFLWCIHAADASVPQRVVSVNLCTDQLLVMLANPERIVSLTHLAADPSLSYVAAFARRFAVNHGEVEEVLSESPDLVLAGTVSAGLTVAFLRQRGVTVVTLAMPDDFDGIRALVRQAALVLGEERRGEDLIAAMDRDLASIPPPGETRPRALAWQPGGFTAGAGTLTDAVLRAAGYDNFAAVAGLTGYGYLALETVVAGRPDLLVTDARLPDRPSLREALLQHPALARGYGAGDRVEVPAALLACGGPFTARAAVALAERIRR